MGSAAAKELGPIADVGVKAYPDMERFEIIGGVVYAMAPPSWMHERVIDSLRDQLKDYFKGGDCVVAGPGLGVKLEEDKTWEEAYVIPDLMVVCPPRKITEQGVESPPSLIVEVVSKSNSSNDLSRKRVLYMEKGVKEYWMVLNFKSFIRCVLDEKGQEDLEMFGSEIESAVFPGLKVTLEGVEKW